MEHAKLEALCIRRIAGGDKAAFSDLYRAYQAPVFRFLVRMVGATGPAEELTNDVMLAVWRGAGSYRGDAKPSTWIFGIAHHKALNALRQRRPPTVDVDTLSDTAGPDEGPERRLSLEESRERIRRALAALPAEQREVVQLTFYHGLSYAEISSVAGCPVNTVKTRMFHARKKLQKLLGAMGLGSETA